MSTIESIAGIKVSEILHPKGGDEIPVNSYVVQERHAPQPDYAAMRRIISDDTVPAEPETPDE